MILDSGWGGGPIFPLVVLQAASPSIWPAVQSLRRGLSTNPGVTMWCVCNNNNNNICLKSNIQTSSVDCATGSVEEMMCVVCVSVTEGNSGDGCDLARICVHLI